MPNDRQPPKKAKVTINRMSKDQIFDPQVVRKKVFRTYGEPESPIVEPQVFEKPAMIEMREDQFFKPLAPDMRIFRKDGEPESPIVEPQVFEKPAMIEMREDQFFKPLAPDMQIFRKDGEPEPPIIEPRVFEKPAMIEIREDQMFQPMSPVLPAKSPKAKCCRCGAKRVIFRTNLTGAPLCRYCVETGLSGALGRLVLLSPKGKDSVSGKSYDELWKECRGRLNWGDR